MNLQFNAAVVIKDEIYFSAKNFNGLFRINLRNKQVNFISHFQGDDLWVEHMHQFAIMEGDCIFFIPYFAHYISKYNFKTGELDYLPLSDETCNVGISSIIQNGEKYILVPRMLDRPIIVFNPSKWQISHMRIELEDSIKCFYSDIYSSLLVDGKLLIPLYDSDIILQIDVNTEKYSTIKLAGTKNSAITLAYNMYWVISSDGKTVNCYSSNFEQIKSYTVQGKSTRPYEAWMNCGDSLYLCGCLDDSLLIYDKTFDQWKYILNDDSEVIRMTDKWAFMCGYQEYDGKVYIFPSATNSLLVLNSNGDEETIEIVFNDSDGLFHSIKNKKNMFFFEECNPKIYLENPNLSLIDMLDYFTKENVT